MTNIQLHIYQADLNLQVGVINNGLKPEFLPFHSSLSSPINLGLYTALMDEIQNLELLFKCRKKELPISFFQFENNKGTMEGLNQQITPK